LDLNTYRQIVIGGQKQGKTEGLYLWNWGAKPGDPASALTGFLKSTGVSSYWNDPKFDKMVDATLQETDETTRNAGFKEIQSYLMAETPLIFLYQAEDIYGVANRLTWSPRTDQYILGYFMRLN
jgi:peptide/nickel transport system substrate-binding protein